jgi:hypothetical protein
MPGRNGSWHSNDSSDHTGDLDVIGRTHRSTLFCFDCFAAKHFFIRLFIFVVGAATSCKEGFLQRLDRHFQIGNAILERDVDLADNEGADPVDRV